MPDLIYWITVCYKKNEFEERPIPDDLCETGLAGFISYLYGMQKYRQFIVEYIHNTQKSRR
jgi:hypothetical protein